MIRKRSHLREKWERKFARNESFASFIVSLLIFAISIKTGAYLGLMGDRSTLYSTIASISGSILGLVLAAMTIIISFLGNTHLRDSLEKDILEKSPLEVVISSKQYMGVWKIFTRAIRALAFIVSVSIIALFVDRGNEPRLVVILLFIFGIVYSAACLFRCGWALEQLIITVVSEQQKELRGENSS